MTKPTPRFAFGCQKHSAARVCACVLLFCTSLGTTARLDCYAAPNLEVLTRFERHIRRLGRLPEDRIPILLWQSSGFPTGLESGRVEKNQRVFVDRGCIPLCNPCTTPNRTLKYVPVFKYWQSRGVPVCFLPQGWLQKLFNEDRNGISQCLHHNPETQDSRFSCPVAMRNIAAQSEHGQRVRQTLELLRQHDIEVRLVVLDFESGPYLRNLEEREERVLEQIARAMRCERCRDTIAPAALNHPAGFANIVNDVRAETIRNLFVEPARSVFPSLHTANFFAWPVERHPPQPRRWPAYGYENSGLNVAMPRVYLPPGWGGAGTRQDKMNWNAFRACLASFSAAASVIKENELLIPWIHAWLGGRYLDRSMQGHKVPEIWVMKEMACHMMLRGAESFAIWPGALIGDFPDDFPYPEFADMGQLVYDVKGVQEGYAEMLQYHEFLRTAKPITFDVPGEFNRLGAETATWSGMQNGHVALVRTTSFAERESTEVISVFNRRVKVTFGPRGRNFWVSPDGTVSPASNENQ